MNSTKRLAQTLALYAVLWAVATLGFAWLWDQWMLSGPHGPYRWEGIDFAPYWVGTRAMSHHINPYHSDVTRQIQELVYGGPAASNDPMPFVYPAWLFLLVFPLSLLPYKWAAILFSGALLAATLLFLLKLAHDVGTTRRAQNIWFGILAIGALPFWVISVTKGQLGYVGLLALFLAYRLFDTMPIAGGIALSIATLKPSATFIPVMVFLIAGLIHKNWKFLLAFLSSMVVLLATSCLAVGNWCGDYVRVLIRTGDVPVLWSLDILPFPWNAMYGLLFLGIGTWHLWRALGETKKAWFPIAVLLNLALVPVHWIYDLFFGYLILVDKKVRGWLDTILVATAVLAPWLLILVPSNVRGAVAMVSIPLVWALVVWKVR